jgi:hypothetical protein
MTSRHRLTSRYDSVDEKSAVAGFSRSHPMCENVVVDTFIISCIIDRLRPLLRRTVLLQMHITQGIVQYGNLTEDTARWTECGKHVDFDEFISLSVSTHIHSLSQARSQGWLCPPQLSCFAPQLSNICPFITLNHHRHCGQRDGDSSFSDTL